MNDTHRAEKPVLAGGRTKHFMRTVGLALTLCLLFRNAAGQGRNVQLVGHIGIPGYATGVYVSGDFAYVLRNGINQSAGVQIIDVTTPSAPVLRGFCDSPGYVLDVFVFGNTAYVAAGSGGLQIIDISNPSAPFRLGSLALNYPGEVRVVGGLAYLADGSGLRIVDVTNPSSPAIRGSYSSSGGYGSVAVSNGLAYVTGFVMVASPASYEGHLEIIDVSNPSSPNFRGRYVVPGRIGSVRVLGNIARVLVTDTFWDGIHLAYASRLEIIDISNPTAPVRVGTYGSLENPRDVFLSDGLAYVATEFEGLQVIEIANPVAPIFRGSYDTPGVLWGVCVADGLAYLSDGTDGLWVVRCGGPLPNLTLDSCSFAPAAPLRMQPGDSLIIGGNVRNDGQSPSAPSWVEFWGSRTGGLTLDVFLGDSIVAPEIAAGTAFQCSVTEALYSIPDGPYTIVLAVDRPGQVDERDERDNRSVIGQSRLLVIRPQTNADLTVEGFAVTSGPLQNGQPIRLTGRIRNNGTQDSGQFWIEFWGSRDRLRPSLDFALCDSILVSNLVPGATVDLSSFTRTLYNCPAGIFMAGVFADRPDQVNELDEANNYVFLDGVAFNQSPTEKANGLGQEGTAQADIAVVSADFDLGVPGEAPPGTTLLIRTRVENRGSVNTGPFWLEFWGSRTGGLSLDQFLADSESVADIPAGGAADLVLSRSLYSIPDGPYTFVAFADRPNWVSESNESNNALAVPGKRLLAIRPPNQANLVIENFTLGDSPILTWTRLLPLGGRIRNAGTQDSGPFWIEFWGSHNEDYPDLGFFLCDSIWIVNLAAGASFDLRGRSLYPAAARAGDSVVFCFVDRTDLVNETNEADNCSILRGYTLR